MSFRKMSFNGHDHITKQAARKRFAAGLPFVICPANLRPFNDLMPFSQAVDVERIGRYKDELPSESWPDAFDYFVFLFEQANCVDSETGTYAAFYAQVNG